MLGWSSVHLPILLERLFERSIIARLLGLFITERLASAISAVTLVIDILQRRETKKRNPQLGQYRKKYNAINLKSHNVDL